MADDKVVLVPYDSLSDDEKVSRILQLPVEHIEFLKQEYDMPVDEVGFPEWCGSHPYLVLNIKRQYRELVAQTAQ